MIKVRIIPTLLYKNYNLVKGIKFDSWRTVGNLLQSVKVYSMREVDELVFLDIAATAEGKHPDFELVDDFADECFMPLAVGGGIKTTEDVRRLLEAGADKVVINSSLFVNASLIKNVAKKFGSQCVTASIDVKRSDGGEYEVWTNSGLTPTGKNAVTFTKEVESSGAGEILLTSIDRDGTMEGYDIELIKRIAEVINIPLIASGGAGSYQHMLDAVKAGASAVGAASMFHFTQMTPLEAKQFLKRNGVNVRI